MSLPCRCGEPEVLLVRAHAGYDVRIDAEPLTPLDELRALMAGRSTFTRWTGTGDVHWRSALVIRSRPAGTHPRTTVHRQHDCTPTPTPERVSA